MSKTTTNELTPDAVFRITGRTEFGRLAKKVEGEELDRENETRKKKGWIAIDKPHTRLTIYDAQVVFASGDPNRPTKEEIYAMERMFQTKAHGTSNCFTGMNKGNSLPWVYYQPDPSVPAQRIILERDLASGLLCTMFLRVFKSSMNNGVALEGIILHEPVQYFAGSNDNGASVLSKFGINIDPNAASVPIGQPPINYPNYEPDIIPHDELNDGQYTAPGAQQQPYGNAPAPMTQPMQYTNNAPQNQYTNPAQPNPNYPNQQGFGVQPPQQPAGYPNQANQGGYAGQQPYNNNYNTQAAPASNTGIRYDPNAPNN